MDKEAGEKKKAKRGLDDLADLKLYTLPELAPVLGVTRVSLLGHIKRGDLPARKIAGKWRITRAGIEAFINGPSKAGARDDGFDAAAYLEAIQERQEARRRLRGEDRKRVLRKKEA